MRAELPGGQASETTGQFEILPHFWETVWFRLLCLLALAGINAAWYQYKYYPHMAEWDTAESVPAGPRIVAVLSLALWIVVIACGRLTAYEL